MIIVLLLLFQSLCLYCQRLVLYVHDRCFPRNVRLLQEVAETVGDRKAPQRLAEQQLEQQKRSQKRRILEPILPLVGGLNSEACRFCAHSPQGYCRHHFHLQELQLHRQRGSGGEQDFRQIRRIKRELKRTIGQQQQQLQPTRSYRPVRLNSSWSSSSLSSGYASLTSVGSQEEAYFEQEIIEDVPLEEEVELQDLTQEDIQQPLLTTYL
ncbi:uncharacterized protein LOC27206201 [Drosophila simulans]|uniref:GD12020 n=1 Tax=Drosophila simulans TaxID=7240 RepID=B4NRX1_DROSI|nr:uncharacterized protein LOC27206201 [Drosophila simulans]EDX15349.1 GD12020 [Drosophila simulans]KMY88218.1 uncharacterized protein Dsimw501_GD12020 [Drosophila simulans]